MIKMYIKYIKYFLKQYMSHIIKIYSINISIHTIRIVSPLAIKYGT